MATIATKQAQKTADVRYRVALKNNKNIVVYIVRSSDDSQDYQVALVNGRVSSCNCKATKPCYHMRDVQAKEWAREAARREEYCSNFAIYE
jgi:hypothetical protein